MQPLRERLADVKLRELTAGDVQQTLDVLADRLATRTLQVLRNCLERAMRHAEIRDLVGLNLAAVVRSPRGTAGRPSKSLTLEQAYVPKYGLERDQLMESTCLASYSASFNPQRSALPWLPS